MDANSSNEAGFSLIEVLLATALFVFVAFAGFEAVRSLGTSVAVLAQRSAAVAHLRTAVAAIRSDALSSAAIWRPASTCGDAVAFMKKEAGNATSFLVYVAKTATGGGVAKTTLYRGASGNGPMNPCDPTLVLDPVIDGISSFGVQTFSASQLPAHVDPVTGNLDDGVLQSAGISSIAIDSHDKDYDGATIPAGNNVTEVTIDADPVQTTIDVLAGNRPSGFTQVLAYACGDRCKATTVFPETRGAPYTSCAMSYDLPDTATFYGPAAGQPVYVAAGANRVRAVITAYSVNVGYVFSFAGPGGASAREELYVNTPVWTKPGLQDTPIVDARGNVAADYTSNSVRSAGPAQVFADAGGATVLASQIARCIGMNRETDDFQN